MVRYKCAIYKGKRDADGLVSQDKCQGCFNTRQSTDNGGRYPTRAKCVAENAKRDETRDK
jgi:hypothetical protein